MTDPRNKLNVVALLASVRSLVFQASMGGKPHEQVKRDGRRLLPLVVAELARWPKPSSRVCDDGGGVEYFFDADQDAPRLDLHEAAIKALAKLEINGSRLDLAVDVFGWDSAEANGALLGLVRQAWGASLAYAEPTDSMIGSWWADRGFEPGLVGHIAWVVNELDSDVMCAGETEAEAFVDALKAKAGLR